MYHARTKCGEKPSLSAPTALESVPKEEAWLETMLIL